MKKKYFGMFESGNCFLIAMMAMALFQFVFSFIFKSIDTSLGGMKVSSWVMYAVNQIAIVSAVGIYSAVKKTNFLSLTSMNKKPKFVHIFLIPIIAVFCLFAFLPLSNAFAFIYELIHGKASVPIPTEPNIGIFIGSTIIMAILPAFGEEILLRGALVSGLRSKTPVFAIMISALMFSLMHGNPVQTVHQFLFGIVLCIVFLISGSLWTTIFLHFCNNFFTLLLVNFAPNLFEFGIGNYIWLFMFGLFLVCSFFLILVLYLFYFVSSKSSNKMYTKTEYEGFKLYTTDDTVMSMGGKQKKDRFLKSFFLFFGSLFTKRGWQKINYSLSDERTNTIQNKKEFYSIWIALIFLGVYWIVAFISGLVG